MSPPDRPALGDLELQLVQRVRTLEERALARHAVPGRDGAVFQNMGRRPTAVQVLGVLTGPDAPTALEELRRRFHERVPLAFVADIAAGTRVTQVLIEDMTVRELAGRPERFEYRLRLREFVPPPPAAASAPTDAQGPFDDLVQSIDAMGAVPGFRDPTPPLLGMLDGLEAATEGLAGTFAALDDKLGTPPAG